MTQNFTAVYQPAAEGGFVGFVEELPGANTQGETLEETRENLREAVQLILVANRELAMQGVDEKSVIRETLVVAS
jgi:predicted RNase H-like HicB family nuclease